MVAMSGLNNGDGAPEKKALIPISEQIKINIPVAMRVKRMFLPVFSFDLTRKNVTAIAPKINGQLLKQSAEDMPAVISIKSYLAY